MVNLQIFLLLDYTCLICVKDYTCLRCVQDCTFLRCVQPTGMVKVSYENASGKVLNFVWVQVPHLVHKRE